MLGVCYGTFLSLRGLRGELLSPVQQICMESQLLGRKQTERKPGQGKDTCCRGAPGSQAWRPETCGGSGWGLSASAFS